MTLMIKKIRQKIFIFLVKNISKMLDFLSKIKIFRGLRQAGEGPAGATGRENTFIIMFFLNFVDAFGTVLVDEKVIDDL